MAAYVEITIEQGANLNSTVSVNDTQGDALNLYYYRASSQLRKSYYSTSANTMTATITGNANGEITLSMTASNTALLSPGRYVYDLTIANTASAVLYTFPSQLQGNYLFFAGQAGNSNGGIRAAAFVRVGSASLAVTSLASASCTLSASGLGVQITNNAGGTAAFDYSWVKL